MLITCSQHFSNYLMNKLLININFKIIERVYIVALLISRVNVVSILSTLEQVYSHIYINSLPTCKFPDISYEEQSRDGSALDEISSRVPSQ